MSNIYRIGVNIAMTSNGSQVLGVLGRELLGLDARVGGLTKGFSRLKLAIGGALAIGAGVAILGAFKGPLEEARKFEMAMTKFGNFGLGPERTREAAEFAKAMNIAGGTYTENMKRMAEAQGVFRDSGLSGAAALRGAKLAAPTLAKIDFANSALDDESKAKMHSQGLSMLRFIEMKGGVNNPETFNRLADAGFKAINSSGGNVNWEMYRQFMATGSVAAQGLRPDSLFGQMEPVIGELKSRAGMALMTAYNRLTGITRVPNQVAHELVDNGIWDGSKITWNKMGGIKSVNGNPMKDFDTFSGSQFDWYMKNIVPMYDKKGYSEAERNRQDALIGGRTGGMMFSIFRRQHEAIEKSVGAQRQQLGIEGAYKAAGGTLNGKIVDLQARYVNLQERLGEAVLPLAVKGLTVLIPLITKMTDWIGKNPGKVALFAKIAVAVGAGLVALGAAAVGAAVFAGGWVGVAVAGIGAITGAVTAWAVFNWNGLVSAATGIWNFVKRLADIGVFIARFGWVGALMPTGMRPATQADVNGPGGSHLKVGQPIFDANPRALTATARASAVPPPAANQNIQVHTTLNMDGKKVAQVVSNHQARAMGPGMTGSGRADPTASLPAAGAGYAR